MRRKYWIDTFLGTVFIFIIILFAGKLFRIFDVLDPIGDAIADIEITDLVFSELRSIPPADTNIVIVNFGNLPREGIADLVGVINKYDPKVIGIDAFFSSPKDSISDRRLATALSQVEKLVLVSKLIQFDPESESFMGLHYSHEMFNLNAIPAFANLTSLANNQDQFKICRTFPPSEYVDGQRHLAFGVQLAALYDPNSLQKILKRNNDTEIINYRGNVMDFGKSNFGTRFYALDWIDVLSESFEPSILKDKIVLLGYMGNTFDDPSWNDKFYTPLNKDYAGKTNPDMFGVVVHANIISMVLNGDYVSQMHWWTGALIGVLLCYLNVMLFIQIHRKLPRWYDGLTKMIQAIEVLLLFFVIIGIFYLFNYKLNLTIAIVAILLASDALEIYFGVIKNVFSPKRWSKIWLQIKSISFSNS